MSIELARYQFHAWSRRGISVDISDPDDLGQGTSTQIERAQVPIGVQLNGNAQTKTFLLVGPGDIIGVNSNMIVRTDPLDGIMDFEPNYLAFLEFYDEEFIWRYTPAAPAGLKLRPWLLLLVLQPGEFSRNSVQVPLPSITVTAGGVFPPMKEHWLWGHMHSNADIPDSQLTDYEQFLISLNQASQENPDQLFSRLICPRQLLANTAYTAFLVPAFETGRLAGLQQDTSTTHAQTPSWTDNGPNGDLPVYFEWSFRTGLDEDFESLVKLLTPQPMDARVGIRDMDCSAPGYVEAENYNQPLPSTTPPIIGLEGALKSPSTVSTVYPTPAGSNDSFQIELQKIANLPYTIIGQANSGDPVISIPIYGSNHAKTSATDIVELDVTSNSWVNDLNRDPRTRVPAGFGTTVVQNNQAYFMRKAWAQVAGIVQANALIRNAVFMMNIARQFTVSTFANLPQEGLLSIGRPVLSRVMGSPTTLQQQILGSPVPMSGFSGAFRRLVRPQGRFIKRLSKSSAFSFATMLNGINTGSLTAGPANIFPNGLPNTQDIAAQIQPAPLPSWLSWLIQYRLWLLIAALIVLGLIAVFTGAWVLALVLAAAAIGGYFYLVKLGQQQAADSAAANNLANPQAALQSLSDVPPQPNFSLKLSSEAVAPPPTPGAPGADSVEAAHFRLALADVDERMAIVVPVVQPVAIKVADVHTKLLAALDPGTSFPLRLAGRIRYPGLIPIGLPDKIFPAMAYPDMEDPMYAYLNAISQELLLPNVKLVPDNSISLLETNPRFIESYMVGLNHEMGRELLWNEYPTDERGSYFRQFWDVRGLIEPSSSLSPAQLTDQYKDITPIDTWPRSSLLGTHDNRAAAGAAPEVVLIIRGELLQRYPNTLVFAQKAVPGATPDGPDINTSLSDADFALQIRFPLYKASASPDIQFFGFDLTVNQARGTDPTPGFSDSLGWFFVIQEIPGEPRFGMDVSYQPEDPNNPAWADLSWQNFANPAIPFVTAGIAPNIAVPDTYRWGADSSNMAYILFRRPGMVAVHANQMLQNLNS
jgi:hypothetical protein